MKRPHALVALVIAALVITCSGLQAEETANLSGGNLEESLLLPGNGTQPEDAHKALLPLDGRDYAMFGIAAFALLLAAGGGVGGGPVFVPLYILIGGFTTSHAVALSNVTVLGGALANLLVNVWRRHPHLPRPLIEWDLILVMEPTTILGALLGGYLNRFLPVWLVSVLMAFLLAGLSWKLIDKGTSTFRSETRLKRQVAAAAASSAATPALPADAELTKPLLSGEGGGEEEEEEERAAAAAPTGDAERGEVPAAPSAQATADLQRLLAREARQLPLAPVALLVALFACVAASDTYKLSVPCASPAYWGIVLSVVPVALALGLGTRHVLLARCAVRAAASGGGDGLPSAAAASDAEVHWTPRNTLVYPLVCSAAGLFAGLFGIGGGVIKAPLMLEMGVTPEVAAATSATMVFFTAAAASLVYSHLGALIPDYAVAVVGMAFMLTLAGQAMTISLLRALGRRSVIILAMAALMVTATTVAVVQGVTNTLAAAQSGTLWQWGDICSGEILGAFLGGALCDHSG